MAVPPISPRALWTWDTTGPVPVVTGYPSGLPTKSGIMPEDLRNFVGVKLQVYGDYPQPLGDAQLVQIIRMAEDSIESETGILLCQTYIASPPAVLPQECSAIGVSPVNLIYQRQGYDYDLEDSGYDFQFKRAEEDGWMNYNLRYRPLRSVSYFPGDSTAVKNVAFIYPLLNQYFNVPFQWFVEDHDFAMLRLVPATNVAMLPLFMLELAALGFSDSVPNGIWLQYSAGLTTTDYMTRFSFMRQLVLAEAATIALATVQGTINVGVEQTQIQIDGVSFGAKYNANGAFFGLINQFAKQRDALMTRAKTMVSGPVFTTF